MKTVNVYGPGCKRCEATETMVMSTPGISVDGKLVHAGGLPDAGKLEGWLRA